MFFRRKPRQERVGVLTRMERYDDPDAGSVTGIEGVTLGGYMLYLDGEAEPHAFAHRRYVLNRVEVGERVIVHTIASKQFREVRKLHPAGRKLRWWQI